MHHRTCPAPGLVAAFAAAAALALGAPPAAAGKSDATPIMLRDQGSFLVGGTVVTNPGTFDPIALTPEGQTIHGDHAYVQYQIPLNPRRLPLSRKTARPQRPFFRKLSKAIGRETCTMPSRMRSGPPRPR